MKPSDAEEPVVVAGGADVVYVRGVALAANNYKCGSVTEVLATRSTPKRTGTVCVQPINWSRPHASEPGVAVGWSLSRWSGQRRPSGGGKPGAPTKSGRCGHGHAA